QGWNRDEDTFIVAAYNDRTPGARYLFQSVTGALHKLADINPSIPEADMAPVRPIQYTSRDGLIIHGYLTLRAGREPRGLPCIVITHGGTWPPNSWRYIADLQSTPNRCFCVLRMNFRSSTV